MKHLKAIVFVALALSLLVCSLAFLKPIQVRASSCTPTIGVVGDPTTAGDWVTASSRIFCGFGTNRIYIYTGSVAHGPIETTQSSGFFSLPITYPQISTSQQEVKTQAEEITGSGQVYWSGIFYELVYRARSCQSVY